MIWHNSLETNVLGWKMNMGPVDNQKGLIGLGILHTTVVNMMNNINLKSSTNLSVWGHYCLYSYTAVISMIIFIIP